MNTSADSICWYALRAAYGGHFIARARLQADGWTCYVPTRRLRVPDAADPDGYIVKEEALVNNLIFVRASRGELIEYKRRNEMLRLRFMMNTRLHEPIIVPDKQMEDFMRVVESGEDELTYLDHPDIVLTKGMPVEVIAGPLQGVQGHVVRMHRDRRVIVSIAGLVAVAAASMPMSWLKVL